MKILKILVIWDLGKRFYGIGQLKLRLILFLFVKSNLKTD